MQYWLWWLVSDVHRGEPMVIFPVHRWGINKGPEADRLSEWMIFRHIGQSSRWNIVQRATKNAKLGYRQFKGDPIMGNPLSTWGLKHSIT